MTAIYEYGPRTDFYQGGSALEGESLRDEIERLRPLAELGRMAATVAHEVRNPLAGISANAELLREVLSDPDDRDSVDVILGEVDRLGNLVTDLMLYSREREPTMTRMSLAALMRQVCELSRTQADAAGVELISSGSGDVLGDQDLSRQAMLNIVRNGLQASPAGSTMEMIAADDHILIIDQGGGVPADIREEIFTPFVTGRTRGLGLGAAVARRCLRRQGGDIVLRHTSDAGSTFCLHWNSRPKF